MWCGAVGLGSASGAEVVRVGNDWAGLGIEGSTGSIVEWTERGSTQNLVAAASGAGDLWRIEFAGRDRFELRATEAREFRIEPAAGVGAGLQLVWSGFGRVESPELRVEARVEMDRDQGVSRWRLGIDGMGEYEPLRIRFPRLLDLATLEQERLVVPFWVGLMAENPRRWFTAATGGVGRREYDYPGHASVQCLTFYGEGGPGVYVACDDTTGYRKLFGVFSEREGSLSLEVVHLPESGAAQRGRYHLPYRAVLGTFRGSWFDAAERYREWATNQVWARESRWKRGQVPRWIGETGLWVWNRGRSPGVLEPAMALQRAAGMPVSVFWHWWHGCAYDAGFPEYLPPREGEGPFQAALARAHAHDVRALVYMNQRLWGMTTASWTNEPASRWAVKAADGRVIPEVYNRFTQQACASMCMGTEFWRAKYAGLGAEAFHRLGVDGIYMDQACSSLACYDPAHGHPLGGGAYWMGGFRKLAAELRRRCDTRGGIALAGEGCAENWLPYLDLMLALDVSRERYAGPDGWEAIPFFHAVYHGYGVFYGSYASLTYPPYDDLWPAAFAPKEPLALLDRKFARQFALEQARSFVWGQQPTLANFLPHHLETRREEMAYVIRLARLRRRALNYLQDGVMLPPPHVEIAHDEIPMSRLSIYAGQQEGLQEFTRVAPRVLASAWRGPERGVAVAVANLTDQRVRPVMVLDQVRYGLPREGRLRVLTERGIERRGKWQGTHWIIQPDLEPWEAQVLELGR